MSAAMFTHWGRSMLDDRLDLWVQGSDGRAIERTDLPIIDLRASPRSGEIAGTGDSLPCLRLATCRSRRTPMADIIQFPHPKTKRDLWIEYMEIVGGDGEGSSPFLWMYERNEWKDWSFEELRSGIAKERQRLCDEARATLTRFGQQS